MKTAALEIKSSVSLSRTLDRVITAGDRVLVRQGRKPVAAVIPYRDWRLLKRLLRKEEDRLDRQAAHKALQEAGEISWTQIKQELGL